MSATRQAAALIEERRSGTVDDILPDMDGLTRKQALKALDNAVYNKLIVCDGVRPPRRKGEGRGSKPAIYRAKPKEEYQGPRFGSVWQYAQQAERI